MRRSEAPEAKAAEILRRLHSIYSVFMSRLAEDPTVETAVDIVRSLTDAQVALTDSDGRLTHASFEFSSEQRVEPPPFDSPLDVPTRIGPFWCATPVSAPRSFYIWLFDEDDDDPLHRMTLLDIAAKRIQLLRSYEMKPVDERNELTQRLVRQMLRRGSPGEVRTMAKTLGHDLDRPHHLLVVEPPPSFARNGFLTIVREKVADRALVALDDGVVVVVVGGTAALRSVVCDLESLAVHEPLRVGVSRVAADGHDLCRAHAQAMFAVHLYLESENTIVRWFEECDLLHLMSRHADEETIHHAIAEILSPLLEYEGHHRKEFLDTLREWLDASDSLDAVAERLNIHRSTLTYRIRRLRELLGDDLRDPDRRFEISLALRLMEPTRSPF